MKLSYRFLIISLSLALTSVYAAESAVVEGVSKPVNLKGILHTGIVGIGGETTGIEIESNGRTIELDLPADLKNMFTLYDKKVVALSGLQKNIQGIETGVRSIVEVHHITLFPVLQSLTGTVDGAFGIGGETTGVVIAVTQENQTKTFELVIPQYLKETARSLFRKKIKVEGIPTKLSGVTTHNRPAFVVEKIAEVEASKN